MNPRTHQLQNNSLVTNKKESIGNKNAKVTVQYIQNTQLFQRASNDHNAVHTAQEHLEIENVEYLEDNTTVEEYIEGPCDKDEFEDNFYPNAIYCLLDLYKIKYESVITKNTAFKVDLVWRDIAKNMQESFFYFNEQQLQHKYTSLREQYFSIQTKEDIENFDYFEQLHDIYKDATKDNIAKGFGSDKKSCPIYKDKVMLRTDNLESSPMNSHDFKSEEIANKEHEFIDMVEKELQAMEDGEEIEDADRFESKIPQNKSKKSDILNNLKISNEQSHKRIRLDSELSEAQPQREEKVDEYSENKKSQETFCWCNKDNDQFSLRLYNQEQERRHREKMSLLERSLKIQERAIEQQNQLLQEIIKHF